MRAIKVRAGSRRNSTSQTLISCRFDGLYSVVIVFSFRIVLLCHDCGSLPRISPLGLAVKTMQEKPANRFSFHRGPYGCSGSVSPKFVGAILCGCPFGGQAR